MFAGKEVNLYDNTEKVKTLKVDKKGKATVMLESMGGIIIK